MLAVMALEEMSAHNGMPLRAGGEVLVTGAGGGVGGMAVAILAHLGYRVVASTGRSELHEYLRSLGAVEILDRAALSAPSDKPLESARWAGAVDAVGGDTLAGVLRSMAERSSVAVCGNVGGATFATTVLPFILRGVSLVGIESVREPLERRRQAWERLARELPKQALHSAMQVAPLEDVPALSQEILQGQVRGRVVIDLEATRAARSGS
jgi:acrylyl-CoA reductase (NADPH)